jgi:lactate dehydrogenase-like 2-hydroxyacid dehydrogenase
LSSGRAAGRGAWTSSTASGARISRSNPLIRYAASHENLVISPHIGGVTHESQRMAYARTVEMILNFLRHEELIPCP